MQTIQGRLPKGERGSKLQFYIDGDAHISYEGENVAAAMLANSKRKFRLSPKNKEPRGFYCGMGSCFECIVTIDGVANVRACMTQVKEGMKVETGTKVPAKL